MFAPYPSISVRGDVLIGVAVALKSLLNEVGGRCDDTACGCESSRRINHAEHVLRELDALIEGAEARQAFERYVRSYERFIEAPLSDNAVAGSSE